MATHRPNHDTKKRRGQDACASKSHWIGSLGLALAGAHDVADGEVAGHTACARADDAFEQHHGRDRKRQGQKHTGEGAHAHEGDGGRHGTGKAPRTPWGQLTLGYRTRHNKKTNKMIVRSRHEGKRK